MSTVYQSYTDIDTSVTYIDYFSSPAVMRNIAPVPLKDNMRCAMFSPGAGYTAYAGPHDDKNFVRDGLTEEEAVVYVATGKLPKEKKNV